jgi:hypothetical protein
MFSWQGQAKPLFDADTDGLPVSRKRHTYASLRAIPLALHGSISILLLGKKPQISMAHATDLAGRLNLATAGAEREASITGRGVADGPAARRNCRA